MRNISLKVIMAAACLAVGLCASAKSYSFTVDSYWSTLGSMVGTQFEGSGVEAPAADGREIVCERLYTTSGIPVTVTADTPRAVYIVVRTYSDGTTAATKEVR